MFPRGGVDGWGIPAGGRSQAEAPPRVALLIESSRSYGRGILRGIADYLKVCGPWSVFHEERSLGDVAPTRLIDGRRDMEHAAPGRDGAEHQCAPFIGIDMSRLRRSAGDSHPPRQRSSCRAGDRR